MCSAHTACGHWFRPSSSSRWTPYLLGVAIAVGVGSRLAVTVGGGVEVAVAEGLAGCEPAPPATSVTVNGEPRGPSPGVARTVAVGNGASTTGEGSAGCGAAQPASHTQRHSAAQSRCSRPVNPFNG